MPRFFVDKSSIHDNSITITGDDAKHILLSLRARPGEVFTLCDADGTDYVCEFCGADKNEAYFEIKESMKNVSEPCVDVTLYMALVKADKFEEVVQRSVELGIKRIVPVLTKRCVSRPDQKGMKTKLERWNKIAKEAAGQSQRGFIPRVCELMDIENALCDMKNNDFCFVCYENEASRNLKSVLSGAVKEGCKSYGFMVGAEGGFEQSEIQLAQQMGVLSVGLGKRILRAQTAPLCVLSAIMYATDNLA